MVARPAPPTLHRADFMDLFLGSDQESLARLKVLCAPSPQPDEGSIIEYLAAGASIAATTLFEDRLANGKCISSFEWKSDGSWIWSNALEYYVRRYHFRVPAVFLRHMVSLGWAHPKQVDGERVAKALRNMCSQEI